MDRGVLLRTTDTAFAIMHVRCFDPITGIIVGNSTHISTDVAFCVTGVIVGVFRQPVNVKFPCSVADGTGMQPDAFFGAGRPFCNGAAVPDVVSSFQETITDRALPIMLIACIYPITGLMSGADFAGFRFRFIADGTSVGCFSKTDASGFFGDHTAVPCVFFCFTCILVADGTNRLVNAAVRHPLTFTMGVRDPCFFLLATECAAAVFLSQLFAGRRLFYDNPLAKCTLPGFALTADGTSVVMAGHACLWLPLPIGMGEFFDCFKIGSGGTSGAFVFHLAFCRTGGCNVYFALIGMSQRFAFGCTTGTLLGLCVCGILPSVRCGRTFCFIAISTGFWLGASGLLPTVVGKYTIGPVIITHK